MRKLPTPPHSPTDTFDMCVNSLSSVALQTRMKRQKPLLDAAYQAYEDHTKSRTWFNLPCAQYGKENQKILGDLTKKELIDLYSSEMVGSKGPARKVYDEIRLLAHEKCPYCDGCGEIVNPTDGGKAEGNVDHFLPKAWFPKYSILPTNLVSSCETCNGGMGSKSPRKLTIQPLHPYFEADHIYEEKWISASISGHKFASEHESKIVSFYVNPPDTWGPEDRERVSAHFENCNLGERYRSRSETYLAMIIHMRKTSHYDLDSKAYSELLNEAASVPNLPINGVHRTLHYALAESTWFCAHDFRS